MMAHRQDQYLLLCALKLLHEGLFAGFDYGLNKSVT